MKILFDLLSKILRCIRKFILNKTNPLEDSEFSLITNNCLGGILYKDFGVRFNSPTINLYIKDNDFLKFIEDFDYYINTELKEEFSFENYPVGKLDDIEIHFLHYKTFDEAKVKWIDRTKRINYQKLFFIMSDTTGMEEKLIRKFDNLPVENKVLFSNQKNLCNRYNSTFYIKGFEKQKGLGFIWNNSGIFGSKYYDQFNWIDWLNNKLEKENKI